MRNHIAMLVSASEGRAVTLRRDIHVAIQPHALKLTLLQMGGEANSLWGYKAEGSPINTSSQFIGDPRDKKMKSELLLELLETVFIPYLSYCYSNGLMPQIFMANDSCRRALKVLVEDGQRMGFNPELPEKEKFRFSQLNYLVWLLMVLPEKAQPLLVSACDLLCSQFALPMPAHNCQHLGACLAWINPGAGQDGVAASFDASQVAASLLMRPETETHIEPAVSKFSIARTAIYNAKKAGNPEPMTAKHAMKTQRDEIAKVIKPELERMHELLIQAFETLSLFPPSEAANMLTTHYADDFERNWPKLPGKGFWNIRHKDSPRAGSALIRREGINQSTASLLERGDKFTEMWSINSGKLVVAEILSGRMEGNSAFLLLATPQQIVRSRTNDLLNAQHSMIKSVVVREKQQADNGYFMLVEVKKGIRGVSKIFREMRDAELVGDSLLLSSGTREVGSVAADAGRRFKRANQINDRLDHLREMTTAKPVDEGESFATRAKSLLMKGAGDE